MNPINIDIDQCIDDPLFATIILKGTSLPSLELSSRYPIGKYDDHSKLLNTILFIVKASMAIGSQGLVMHWKVYDDSNIIQPEEFEKKLKSMVADKLSKENISENITKIEGNSQEEVDKKIKEIMNRKFGGDRKRKGETEFDNFLKNL